MPLTTHTPHTEAHTDTHKSTVRGYHKKRVLLLRSRQQKGYTNYWTDDVVQRVGMGTVWPFLCGSCPVRLPITCEHRKSSARCQRTTCNRYDARRMLLTSFVDVVSVLLLLLLLLRGCSVRCCCCCCRVYIARRAAAWSLVFISFPVRLS